MANNVAWARMCLACWKEWDMAGDQERDLGEPMRTSVRGRRMAAAFGRRRQKKLMRPRKRWRSFTEAG